MRYLPATRSAADRPHRAAPRRPAPPRAMPSSVVRVVDAYVYRVTAEGTSWLLLRRAPGVVYAGQWRMVGGKIRPGEAAWEAAWREVVEETGRRPSRLWTVPSMNAFYEWRQDRVNLVPPFAACLDADPVLDDEHDAFAWLDAGAASARLAWPEQRRLLTLADRLLARGVPPELDVPPPSGR